MCFSICRQVSLEFCISMLDMPLLIYSRQFNFFRLQVCLNVFFLSRSSCLSSESLVLLEIFSSRDCKFSFSVSLSWSNHLFCDLHLILLPLAFNPASLHASTKVSLSNSDAVSMLSCFTAASNPDWIVRLWFETILKSVLRLDIPEKPIIFGQDEFGWSVSKESRLTNFLLGMISDNDSINVALMS